MIGSYSRSNLELKPVGILEVKLVQAKNLTNKDIIGKSDPYAVIFVSISVPPKNAFFTIKGPS